MQVSKPVLVVAATSQKRILRGAQESTTSVAAECIIDSGLKSTASSGQLRRTKEGRVSCNQRGDRVDNMSIASSVYSNPC